MAMKRDLVLLTLLGLLAYLPGLASLPVIDRDEARYAQSVVQMVETGDYIDIRLQDEPRYKKPVGAYWAQVAAIFATGQADDIRAGERPIWAQRLPSVLGALIAVWATYLTGQALFGRREAFVGAALLAVSVSLVFEAHQAKTDALLVGACAVALYGLVKGRAWPLWLAIGAGVLVKGPVIVGVMGLAVASLSLIFRIPGLVSRCAAAGSRAVESEDSNRPVVIHSSSRPRVRPGDTALLRPHLRPLPILVTLAFVLPWFIAISVVSDGAFYSEALGRDFGGKLGFAQESHGGPPGYYLLTALLMWWPGVLALPVAAVWSWRERQTPAVALLLCWLVPMWLVLEFVPTKLPHYTLPLYPALALLCGAAWVRTAEGDERKWRKLGGVLFAPGAFAVAFLAASGALATSEGAMFVARLALFGVLLFTLGAALRQYVRYASTGPVFIAGGLAAASVFTLGNSAFRAFTGDISTALAQEAGDARIVTQVYREPSLAYLAGTGTRLDLCRIEPGDFIVVVEVTLVPTCASSGLYMTGINYADGSPVTLNAFRTDACEPETLTRWAREQADPTLDCGE